MSSTPAEPGPPANRTAPAPAPAAAALPPANSSSPSPPVPASSAPPSLPPPTTPSAPPPLSGAPATPSTTPPATPGTPAAPSPPLGTPSLPAERSTPAGTPPAPVSPPPSNSWLTTPLVVGIAVGGLVVVLLASLLCVCLFKKKKKHHPHPHPPPPPPPHLLHYYGHPLPPPPPPPPQYKGDHYGGVYQNWQHNAPPPPPDHVVKTHSHTSPPPPLNVNRQNSSGSGSNYSGGESQPPPSPGTALGFSRCTFTYEDLVAATNGFSDANLLGQAGFGYVHKGVLPNGTEVAVKQLIDGTVQREREFQAEVEINSRLHHKHLVTLVGYCISGGKRLLVYEFVPNNTLEFHLHGFDKDAMQQASLEIQSSTEVQIFCLVSDSKQVLDGRQTTPKGIVSPGMLQYVLTGGGSLAPSSYRMCCGQASLVPELFCCRP